MKIRFALASLLAVSAALARPPADPLATPPPDARVWTITTDGGARRYGQVSLWTDARGTHWSRLSVSLRGFVTEIEERNRFSSDGTLESLIIRGRTPQGDAAESFQLSDGEYRWESPVDHGSGRTSSGVLYAAFGGTLDSQIFLFEAMLRSPTHSVGLLPSGEATIAPLTTLEVGNGRETKTLTACVVTGLGLSPLPVWMEGDAFFAMVPDFLPEGWEKASAALSRAQDEALAKRAPALVERIAGAPAGPIAFERVEIFDAEARAFLRDQTVIVERGRITAVGPAASVSVPAGSQVVSGPGKTLIPGLWDCHLHYGDDSTGPLLLASGITSVRDPGNLPAESMARKKRIDDGELLGPRIVPSLLIDGPGPFAAQVGVVASTLEEALADVRRAKADGYFAVKLYGSLDPAWVKPMADLAHRLGLRVHGHVPHGMRPLEAARAGYDELTHINYVMMQAMPDEVVRDSNTLARLTGTAKFAADVDLRSPQMTAYLDELARRGTAVDPTLVAFESSFVPDAGEYSPGIAPYAGTLPPQFARGFLAGALAPSPDLPRERMRASFSKLVALVGELHRRRIPLLAGTDGSGLELVRELELYVRGGLTPEEALATATIEPARAFHLEKQTGSIARGKLAELALVDGDPAKNVGDLRQVELVLRAGRVMEAGALRAAIGISGPPARSRP